jgi:hypothetical protein
MQPRSVAVGAVQAVQPVHSLLCTMHAAYFDSYATICIGVIGGLVGV